MPSEIETLRAELAELKHALGVRAQPPHPWRLSPYELVAWSLLLRHPVMTFESLRAAALLAFPDKPAMSMGSVRMLVWRLRKKLDRHDVELSAVRGRGWAIRDEDRLAHMGQLI